MEGGWIRREPAYGAALGVVLRLENQLLIPSEPPWQIGWRQGQIFLILVFWERTLQLHLLDEEPQTSVGRIDIDRCIVFDNAHSGGTIHVVHVPI